MLQHAFYNGICTLAMMVNFFKVLFYIALLFRSPKLYSFRRLPYAFQLPAHRSFHCHFAKVVDEVQRVLYFMCNACSELTK
jgi:hypothetical protein